MSKLGHTTYLSAITALIVMVVWLARETQKDMDTREERSGAPLSMTVLPFSRFGTEVLSADIGINLADEIRVLLARSEDLRIASRTSTSQLLESNRDISEIGTALSVSWFLEGSVRIDKGRIRVSTQLVDAVTDAHVWSETYDGTIGDLEMIAANISETVLTAKDWD